MSYIIAWRDKEWKGRVRHWTYGISLYKSIHKARKQLLRFKEIFEQNHYIIVRTI